MTEHHTGESKTPVAEYRNPYDSEAGLKLDIAADGKEMKEEQAILEATDGKKVKKAYKRFFFWVLPRRQWWYAVAATTIVLLVVLLLIVWFVIIKAIFQHFADGVKVTVNYLDIVTVPTSSDATSVGVSLSMLVQHDLSISASTDAMTASLYYEGTKFGSVPFPALDLASGEQTYNLTVNDDLTVTDTTTFMMLAEAILLTSNVTLEAKAEVKAHGLGVSYGGINFERELAIKTLNGFSNPEPSIEAMNMTECTDDYYYIGLNSTIVNPGQVGLLGIGTLNLSVYYEDSYLGYAITQNASQGVPRGSNDVEFMMSIAANNSALKKMVVGLIYSSGVLFHITGDNPYATSIPLLQEPLAALNMSINYTDGISKVKLNSECNLAALL